MVDVNVICVYNKQDLYDNMKQSVIDTISDQITCTFVPLDNTDGKFSSAAGAFNYAINNLCDAEVLVFTHQDIVFYDGAINSLYKKCKEDSKCIFGAAGVKAKQKLYDRNHVISAISQNERDYKPYTMDAEEVDVFVLDECLFACNSNVFSKIMFDSKVCDSWHLYAADLCMQAHLNRIGVRVLALDVLHISEGVADSEFYKCLNSLARKYKGKYKIVQGTCGFQSTNAMFRIIVNAYNYYRRIRRTIN